MSRYTSQNKEKFEDYDGFVEKFKPKLTTDDCYTPENIWDTVAGYVSLRYGVPRDAFVRPFWPGGDFEAFDYPEGCAVVDNPPFSILKKICSFYCQRGIRFFLFAPAMTGLNRTVDGDVTFIAVGAKVTYENGANVATSFLTNMEPDIVLRTSPGLYRALDRANRENERKMHAQLPTYEYPDHVITGAIAQRYGKHGLEYSVRRDSAIFIRKLDAQRESGKGIFGGGLLLSDRAAAERAAAERAASVESQEDTVVWTISDREREIISTLA